MDFTFNNTFIQLFEINKQKYINFDDSSLKILE
jgi:hypothetical protein